MLGLSAETHGYPRPQLRRAEWTSLNGEWDFALDPDARWKRPDQVTWNAVICVPFAPETRTSGIADLGRHRACWYRRTVPIPRLNDGERLMLHVGAVDYAATVWVGDRFVGRHEGGYTPFAVEMTHGLTGGETATLVVRAEDDPDDLAQPRGKQDWELNPHG